jgi:hypothetical protein
VVAVRRKPLDSLLRLAVRTMTAGSSASRKAVTTSSAPTRLLVSTRKRETLDMASVEEKLLVMETCVWEGVKWRMSGLPYLYIG